MSIYDAIVIGSGPNGFAAAITLQQQGLRTLIIEGSDTLGGGMRTKLLTLPDFYHDVCSAVHPMALTSPFFTSLALDKFGLEFVFAPFEIAHPIDEHRVALLHRDFSRTADSLASDAENYKELFFSTIDNWQNLSRSILGPLRRTKHPLLLAEFGLKALQSAQMIARRFQTVQARALWAGICAHGSQPLGNLTTAAIGLVLGAAAHRVGWPIVKGGTQRMVSALTDYYLSIGGQVESGNYIDEISKLPDHKILILDVHPKNALKIKGLAFNNAYRKQISSFRLGPGIFKMDWALSEPIPFLQKEIREASTVHLGGRFEDIALAEYLVSKGEITEDPFVILSEPSRFDSSRAPSGKHTAWAYCHVPHGSTFDCSDIIENKIERFAPGFKEVILARHSFNSAQMEYYNPNYIGGDITGGVMDLGQLFTRPTFSLSPYRTSIKNVYIASSSTPPGGGVHGMCGYHAARTALMDHFNIKLEM